MKSISLQYQELKEGKLNKHQFLRNARMMFPNFVTNHNSFEDSVKILKNRGLLSEGDAVKGTPDKAPEYSPVTPDDKIKYKKVEQSPEVQEQDGIYPATTITDIPKQKPVKKVKNESDGLEEIKPKDTKNEMKVIRIVKESKNTPDADGVVNLVNQNSLLKNKFNRINTPQEFKDLIKDLISKMDPTLRKNTIGLRSVFSQVLGDIEKSSKSATSSKPAIKESKESKKKLTEDLGDNFVKSIDLDSVEVDGIDMRDYPDFSDAFITYAEFKDGTPLNDTELDELNSYSDIVYSAVEKRLFETKLRSTIKKMIQETLAQLTEERMTGGFTLRGIDTEYKGDYYEGDLDVSFSMTKDPGSYDQPPSSDIERLEVEFSNLKKYDENTNDFIEITDSNVFKELENHVREEKFDDIVDAINQYED